MAFFRRESEPVITEDFAREVAEKLKIVPNETELSSLVRYSGEVKRVDYSFEDDGLSQWYTYVDSLDGRKRMVLNKSLAALTRHLPDLGLTNLGDLRSRSGEYSEKQEKMREIGNKTRQFLEEIGLL